MHEAIAISSGVTVDSRKAPNVRAFEAFISVASVQMNFQMNAIV